jgi:predicted nucleic acid-binding protein
VRLLVDTNVVLDVLLERQPYASAAAQVLALADTERVHGGICATTLTTIHYLAAKAAGRRQAARLVRDLLDVFAVAPVSGQVLMAATGLDFDDFEDAVVHEAARAWGAAGIVTRDRSGFATAGLPIFEPDELLSAIAAAE